MEFKIKNIGIIKDSTILLDGLTVVTGANNSGKSTVGKALYSSIEGLNNLGGKRSQEIRAIFLTTLREITMALSLDEIARYIDEDKIDESLKVSFYLLAGQGYRAVSKQIGVVEQYEKIKELLNILSPDYFYSIINRPRSDLPKKWQAYLKNFDFTKDKALRILANIEDVMYDEGYIKFSKISVMNLFSKEFKGQIYPTKGIDKEKRSKVSLSKNGDIAFDFSIVGKQIINANKIFNKLFYNNAILIDDPYVIDNSISEFEMQYRFFSNKVDYSHNKKISRLLFGEDTSTAIEDYINNRNCKEIIDEISKILPGNIVEKNGALFYTENNSEPLSVENLATGSKIFSIIKTLLEKGAINYDTMLILDEPEAHLHPEWQNIMSEIIVLLVKKLGVNILLTTHSINFLLALETYMHKYAIEDITHFYSTEYVDEQKYMVNYKCVDNSIHEIYDNLSYPYDSMVLKKFDITNKEE
ncbi:MAG: AAA family ATPase [Clostridia bacterium]|nr:AAA family ATPase [Clostridia bacterium]